MKEQVLPLLNVWGVWTFFAIITTFFLFDWMLKENRPSMRQRWLFLGMSFKKYALGSLLLLTGVIYVIDIVTAVIFKYLFQDILTIRFLLALFVFRVTINIFVFLLATTYRQLFMYYLSGLAIALLLVVVGGAIIPLQGLTSKWAWIEVLSPVQSLLSETISPMWFYALVTLLVIWIWKGGKSNA